MSKPKTVTFMLKFDLNFSKFATDEDMEHYMRLFWSKITNDFHTNNEDLTLTTPSGVFTVSPNENNPGCSCELCNPKT